MVISSLKGRLHVFTVRSAPRLDLGSLPVFAIYSLTGHYVPGVALASRFGEEPGPSAAAGGMCRGPFPDCVWSYRPTCLTPEPERTEAADLAVGRSTLSRLLAAFPGGHCLTCGVHVCPVSHLCYPPTQGQKPSLIRDPESASSRPERELSPPPQICALAPRLSEGGSSVGKPGMFIWGPLYLR